MGLDLNVKPKTAKAEAAKEAAKEVKVQEGATPVASKDTSNYGSKRNAIAFVRPLGDPSDPDTTTTEVNGEKTTKVTSTIVGYKFKALEDIKIPNCGTTEAFKRNPMDYETLDWIDVKAGTEFALTPFETAFLLSQPEYNGGCDGGERPVNCSYARKALKMKDSDKISAVQQVPRVVLRAATGSIKDFDIEDVLTFEKVTVNNVTRKKREIKPGFEKWAPLAAVATRKARVKSETDVNTVNRNAEAFLNFVKAKAHK